ncbi:MAG: type I phosphomannose isomerase catalytic subunit [Bacteroidia bacterium]|nr:type I phosphomannose isomerase catalytic subunit [Bacteroidia bacterium]
MNETPLYPLCFQPIFKDKIWGGNKIKTILGKDFSPLPNCGETWEISGVKGDISVVKEGTLAGQPLTDIISKYKGKLIGEQVYQKFGTDFPLLVKFIDANEDLSIQVHPDDALARLRHNSFGKTEMWYIFQADEGSSLITGFNRPLTKEIYQEYFQSGRIMEILNRESVTPDDVFFLPAGRVHTIGKGLLLAEIQQTSDITYRIYDFDRRDDSGKLRDLHVEESLDAIDYRFYGEYKTSYPRKKNKAVNIATSAYFSTQRIHADQPLNRDYSGIDSFVIYVCVGGTLRLKDNAGNELKMSKGDVCLLPAITKAVELIPEGEYTLLEAWVPPT